MAATGKEKWEKYFSKKIVETLVQSPKTGIARVFDAEKKQIDTLKHGYPITVPIMPSYEPRYQIQYKKNNKTMFGFMMEKEISKPISEKGQVQRLNIDVANLLKSARTKAKVFPIAGVPVQSFVLSSAKEIADKTLQGLKANPNVNEKIISVMENYFKQSDPTFIDWGSDIAKAHKTELGSFIGELLIGYLAFKNRGDRGGITPKIIKKKPRTFVLPDDPSFPGIDSAIELIDGSILLVSSKFGTGAAASFFSNILPKGMKDAKTLKNSVFRDIVISAKEAGITIDMLENKRGGREILYYYGQKHILKNKVTKSNVLDIFRDIVAHEKHPEKLSPATLAAIQKMLSFKDNNPKIAKHAPGSFSAFLSQKTMSMLKNDKNSMDEMYRILAGKNFLQANLDKTKWLRGDIHFKVVSTKKVKLNFSFASAMDKIKAPHGLINYTMKA
ncbi:MAG: hypothetical protein HOE30_10445 [Deltaproteobacteria bacterium]|nr:hypothetical protein [Deltaproteobacteria bacterium]